MPIQYAINTADELSAVQVRDDVELIDLFQQAKNLLNEQDFPWEWPQLIDLRGMRLKSNFEATEPFVRFLVDQYRPRIQHAIAVVVDGHADATVLAEIYRVACNLPATELFDDYGMAVKWLLQQTPLCAPPPAPLSYSAEARRSW